MDRFKQLEDSMLLGPQSTEQDLQQAKRHGIKTVIDFRLPSETPTWASAPELGITITKVTRRAHNPRTDSVPVPSWPTRLPLHPG